MTGGIFVAALVITVALIFDRGLWQNLQLWVNILFAALVATMTFEPAANYLATTMPSMAQHADFLSLWAIFAVVLFALRLASDFFTSGRLTFSPAVDKAGGTIFALAATWTLVCFLGMTLHTAPLSREFLRGSFKAEEPLMFGQTPDRDWLAFVQALSLGAFSRDGTEQNPEAHAFDPNGEFMLKYAARREWLQNRPVDD